MSTAVPVQPVNDAPASAPAPDQERWALARTWGRPRGLYAWLITTDTSIGGSGIGTPFFFVPGRGMGGGGGAADLAR